MQKQQNTSKANPSFEQAQIEETALLQKVANGDRASFRALHDRFGGVVHSTIYKVLNDRQDTEDVAQEVFAQVWKKAHMYNKERGKPLTWVCTMARNRAIDRLRSKQRRAKLRDALTDAQQEDAHVHAGDAADAASLSENKAIVRSAVLQLSDDQRQAIEMAYFGGLTQSEIANALGQPLGTVKARIRRGIQRMRGFVEPAL